VVAPEVLVLLNVELEPDTLRGSLLGFWENAPPCRTDSPARESLATAPGPSWTGILLVGSVLTLIQDGPRLV
jgi:hypothetical protein